MHIREELLKTNLELGKWGYKTFICQKMDTDIFSGIRFINSLILLLNNLMYALYGPMNAKRICIMFVGSWK